MKILFTGVLLFFWFATAVHGAGDVCIPVMVFSACIQEEDGCFSDIEKNSSLVMRIEKNPELFQSKISRYGQYALATGVFISYVTERALHGNRYTASLVNAAFTGTVSNYLYFSGNATIQDRLSGRVAVSSDWEVLSSAMALGYGGYELLDTLLPRGERAYFIHSSSMIISCIYGIESDNQHLVMVGLIAELSSIFINLKKLTGNNLYGIPFLVTFATHRLIIYPYQTVLIVREAHDRWSEMTAPERARYSVISALAVTLNGLNVYFAILIAKYMKLRPNTVQ